MKMLTWGKKFKALIFDSIALPSLLNCTIIYKMCCQRESFFLLLFDFGNLSLD